MMIVGLVEFLSVMVNHQALVCRPHGQGRFEVFPSHPQEIGCIGLVGGEYGS